MQKDHFSSERWLIRMLFGMAMFGVVSCQHVKSEPVLQDDILDKPAVSAELAESRTESVAEPAPCLTVRGPFCEVFVSDGDCDPRLNEHHYKAGDTLYWINRTQYDTIECYYTEEEYNRDHDPKACAELQDEGRGCIIDDGPECDIRVDPDDCVVVFSRAACDEELIDLGKTTGDKVPGIWFAGDKKMECFFTDEERNGFLARNHLKCRQDDSFEDNICVVD